MSEQDSQCERKEKRVFFSNREIRHVPLNWEHPRDAEGEFVPLQDREQVYTEEEIQEGLSDGWITSREELEASYMPDFSEIPVEEMGICAYETTSEGTPLSPIMPNTPQGKFEIARHCTENYTVFANQKGDIEAWAAILFGKNSVLVDIDNGSIEIHDTHMESPGQ